MNTAIAAAEPDEPPSRTRARDGWFFQRGADRAVEVRCTTGSLMLDPATWASTVASVSAAGQTSSTYQAALTFHNGGRYG